MLVVSGQIGKYKKVKNCKESKKKSKLEIGKKVMLMVKVTYEPL
jgi:hypothetical protein